MYWKKLLNEQKDNTTKQNETDKMTNGVMDKWTTWNWTT
jgi:hypothetical protein